ncbi:MAG: succinate dehydrogenase assembly factor 2 [Pseudomonadota bacterium]|nr:succinate dehydrogenase assembly factor 2 [Pseudomonadota bacterium]
MTGTDEALDLRRKKLAYRSNYTGTKETDLILGRFAARHLPTFSARQMDLYEKMLEAGDPEILAWVVRRKPVPREFDNDVTRLLLRFDFQQSEA